MTYREARVYLDEVSKYGSVLGLDTIRNLLEELGNPQEDLKFIHIAGTNGKGSVLAYISTVLKEAGFRTGRYISPSVISYLEKIQIDGEWIRETEFAELVEEVHKAVVRMETDGKACPTVFEMETAIAFLYFKNKHCDYVLLEAGMGGKGDATNIIRTTELAVFSSVSYDHMGFLGHTLTEIIENKAGIIKPGCAVVSAGQMPEAEQVIADRAKEMGCPVTFAQSDEAVCEERDFRGQTISYKEWKNLRISLAGSYQIQNAATALEAIAALKEKNRLDISEAVLRRGMEKADWPGRFTCLSEHPLFFVDGAHNEDAAKLLRECVEEYFPDKKKIYIFGVFKDKEYQKITSIMASSADQIFTVNLPNRGRTLDAEILKEEAQKYTKAEAVGDIALAVEKAWKMAGDDTVILAFGSLSYLGAVMEQVRKLADNR